MDTAFLTIKWCIHNRFGCDRKDGCSLGDTSNFVYIGHNGYKRQGCLWYSGPSLQNQRQFDCRRCRRPSAPLQLDKGHSSWSLYANFRPTQTLHLSFWNRSSKNTEKLWFNVKAVVQVGIATNPDALARLRIFENVLHQRGIQVLKKVVFETDINGDRPAARKLLNELKSSARSSQYHMIRTLSFFSKYFSLLGTVQ